MSYEDRDPSIVRSLQGLKDKPAWAVSSNNELRWVFCLNDTRIAFVNSLGGLRHLLEACDLCSLPPRGSGVEVFALEDTHWMADEYAYRVTRGEVDALHMALLLMPDGNAWFTSTTHTPLELGFNLAGRPRIF